MPFSTLTVTGNPQSFGTETVTVAFSDGVFTITGSGFDSHAGIDISVAFQAQTSTTMSNLGFFQPLFPMDPSGTFSLNVPVPASVELAPGNAQAVVVVTGGGGIFPSTLLMTTPTITAPTPPLADGTVGMSYGPVNFAADSNMGAVTWSLNGTLPPGLTFIDGILSGTPTTAGTFDFTVEASNAVGTTTQNLSITIEAAPTPPTITTTSLPEGTVGTAYNQTLAAIGTTPITWAVTVGNLPDGLTLNSTTGVISGTPTTAGTYNFTMEASNTGGSATQALSIVINVALDDDNQNGNGDDNQNGSDNGGHDDSDITRPPGDGNNIPEYPQFGIRTRRPAPATQPPSHTTPEAPDTPPTQPEIEPETPTVSELPYMFGYPDGTFRPNAQLTRAEFAAIVHRLLNNSQNHSNIGFPDMQGHWASNSISFMAYNGFMIGYPDGTFRPNQPITRAEVATVLANVRQLTNFTDNGLLSDIDNHWARQFILAVVNAGAIVGYPDGTFRPDNYITRAEVVIVVNRLWNRSNAFRTDTIFPDVNINFWAYTYIMNATNGS